MVTDKDGFYTIKGHEYSVSDKLTSSMEDYLGMVCRMKGEGKPIRVSSLAASLHVRPSSASKILNSLKEARCIGFKRYGSVMVTEEGYEESRYLLHRHQVLQDFFCTPNYTEDELELVEEIEYFINHRTVANMKRTLSFLRPKNDITGKMG